MENKIELKTIKELLGMNFFVPSYQRGYRWTEQQVLDLLNDINYFTPEKINDDLTWYCLQPLVVKENIEDNKYIIIDGQQRLTTIFIILNCLENTKLSLEYETRNKSKEFLENIKASPEVDNIDFYFMINSKNTIEKWVKGKNETEISKFINKIKNNCKIIWYNINDTDNDFETFKRLNSGKISLSNAELIKALLLNQDNFKDKTEEEIKLIQIEMAGEWDRMEQTLKCDEFWYFINPNPQGEKYNATRIDYIFELILRNDGLKDKMDNVNKDIHIGDIAYDEGQKNNEYFTFYKFNEFITNKHNSNAYKEVWEKTQKTFRTIKSWYDDRELYHYIGYLINHKGNEKDKYSLLSELLCSNETKSKFKEILACKCKDTIFGSKPIDITELEYGKDNPIIHNILLLFNLYTIQNQISEQSRYPFNLHVTEKWSLEHIHARNERRAKWTEEEVKLICDLLKRIGNKELVKNIENNKQINDDCYPWVIKAFEGSIIKKEKDENGDDKFSFDKNDNGWYQTSIMNLALLQGDVNSQFNNKLYPEKKILLAKYEGHDNSPFGFIPICTRNVFFKHYSPDSNNPLIWEEIDGENYLNVIIQSLSEYLNIDILKDDKTIIGLKNKETK